MYPEVCVLLADNQSPLPRRFDILFKNELSKQNAGETRNDQIWLNAKYFQEWTNHFPAFDSVLVHEMAHVAQHYARPIIGKWLWIHHHPPFWLVEGIADYVCFKMGETNDWRCAECTAAFPHYRNGYACAGAFLLYLERNYNQTIVRELNQKLRHGGFSDSCFEKMTGKDLQKLWDEFRHTPAFTPSAARMLDLEEALGFVGGKPPPDIEQRIKLYLEHSIDAPTRALITDSHIPGLKQGNVAGRLEILSYFSQPGGTAEGYITGLKKRDGLPGFLEGEKGTITGALNTRDLNPKYPLVRSFTAEKSGNNASIYHYSISRDLPDGAWRLKRAWRTDVQGRVVEEYPVP